MKKRRLKWLLVGLLILALVFGTAIAAFASNASGNSKSPERKIVVFQDWLIEQLAKDKVLRHAGISKVKDLPLINAAVVLVDPDKEKALRQRPEVLRVDPDALVYTQGRPQKKPPQPAPPPADPEILPWGVDRIDADLVWDKEDPKLAVDPGANAGGGVKVAILDTGIDLDHPDLQANIKGGINTVNPRKSPDDDNGHGTHVAGIIAAVDNAVGVIGTAPEAWLYAVKVLNRQGSGYVSDIIEGLQWCIDNKMQVVNMSFGTSSDVQSLYDAIVKAYHSGMVLVAAAGNSGPGDDTVLYPARYKEVIAVSATDQNDNIAWFSSRGPEVELAAPGVNIMSTFKNGGYMVLEGTSMACPHVTGTAALVIASGVSTRDEIRTRLQATADNLGDPNLFGYGLVDAQEAAAGTATAP